MDPSATLLSLLHKNSTPPETSMTSQSPTTPSYPSSQPTPPPIQSSPNTIPIYNFTHFNTQPLPYNQTIFPPATVPPPPPPPPQPLQLSSQSQQMSPNSNPIASLLETLNTSSSQTTSISVSGTPQPQSILNPISGENEVTTSTGTDDPTLFNIDKASTELKLALFGRNTPATGFDISQQENENQYLADTLLPQNEISQAEEITYPEEATEIDIHAEETDYNNNNNNSVLESIRPSTSSPSTKQSFSTTNKSMFTYTNPFDLLKENSPLSPSQSLTTSSQSTLTSQTNQETSVVNRDNGVFSRPQQQKEPFLSELSAWNVRANSSLKAHSSISDGVKLPRGTIFYNTGKKNEIVLSNKDPLLTTITLVPSELEYRAGKSIAVNAFYICYAVKGGRIRVISTLYGSKTLLRNHEKSILDMCIQDVLSDELKEENKTQLLLAIGSDSKITVWELSEPPSEQAAEIPYKILLTINFNESIDETKSPRYHRALWHPVNRNMFAVATDTNDVLIIDINKILEGTKEMSFKESDILEEKIFKLEMQDKPINDFAFSPDGTILATASDDCVIFWELNFENDESIKPIRKIILDGQQVSSVLFIDGENMSSGQSRYVILGTDRNTILHLYDVESSEYIQSINFLPPPERRPSLNKAYRKEEAMFNCVSFDQETGTLLIANSARISVLALHLHLPHKKIEQLDLYNQNEHESMVSVDDSTDPNVAQFDYMIEFPVNQLIGNFVVVPDTKGISLYCVQSKAVQQYQIAKYLLLPPDLDSCPEYVLEETTLDPLQEEVEDTKKEEQNKVLTTETSELSSHSGGQLPTTDEGNIEKDIIKEVVAVEITNTVTEEHDPETTTVVTEDTSLNEKRVVQDSTTSIMVESTVNSDENESKSQESQKTSSSIKLSGPVVNGTIAKLKEKKKAAASQTASSSVQNNDLSSDSERTSRRKERRERDKDSGNENISNSPETTTRSSGKKIADGTSKNNNGKIGAGERTRKPPEEGQPSSPATGISKDQMQMIFKEIRKIEENVVNKLGKMFSKELEKQFQKIEEERIAHQAAETSRQETILKVVSQTLSNNTSKLLESTIRNEIQNSVLPTLSKMVTNAVDKHAHRGMVEAVNKNIPATIDKVVSENVPRVLSKAPVIESIAKGVSKSIRPAIEETFRENFTSVLIPSYQKATNAMFEQITTTFEAGLQDIAHKSAQSASYSSAYNIDQNTLARLQASIDHISLTVQQLHASINNNNVSSNNVRQELQHQRARSLSGELKRILIPQSATSAPTPSMSHQDTYNNYTPGGRVSSSQPHQIHQQQQFHQSRQQLQHQQHQHQQQLLSPVEPPGLEENLSNGIDRHLEMGNYEDAFVTALASHDLPIIVRLCSKVNPKSVFLPSRPLLSQAVILSLIHHLTLELNKSSELKRAWVEEAIIKLNPKDHEIREHCERILPMVKQRLEEYYYQIASQDNQHSNLKNIGLLIHVVNGLLSG